MKVTVIEILCNMSDLLVSTWVHEQTIISLIIFFKVWSYLFLHGHSSSRRLNLKRTFFKLIAITCFCFVVGEIQD